jgi:hypothetical protein
MVEAVKDPRRVAAGKAGMRARWGEPRIVRLDELTPMQARLVRALVDAAKIEKAATEIQSPVAAEEDRRDRVDHPTAS